MTCYKHDGQRKLYFSLMLSVSFLALTNAQDYQKFRLGFGSGFTLARLNQTVADGGILFTLEPAYHLRDDLLIGFRLEFADTDLYLLYGGNPIASYTVNGQYYLSTGKFKPMVGVGLGRYTVPPYSTDGRSKRIGLYPKVGFDYGHFFLAIEYNLVQSSGAYNLYEESDNYVGIRIGFFVGGSKKTGYSTSH